MTVKEISLTPYPGRVFVCTKWKEILHRYKQIFKEDCPHSRVGSSGMKIYKVSKKYGPVYFVWASNVSTLAHELSHVCLDVFSVIESDPREGNQEPFCYLMGKLMKEAKS